MKKSVYFIIGMIVAAMIIIIVIGTNSIISNAEHPGSQAIRHYANIEVQKNDTLWSIAENYASGFGMSTQEYVDELIRINAMPSDFIRSGSHIIIIYAAN